MKVLITGTAGRVGRGIYKELVQGCHAVGLDRLPSFETDLVGELRDLNLVETALEGVDVVVHAAALHAPHVGRESDRDFREINVEATESLMRAAIEKNIQHFVFTSTTALYGYTSTPDDRAGWIDEASIPSPRTIYHVTKIEAERRLERISEESGIPVTVIQMSRCFPEPADLMAVYRLNRGVDLRDVATAHSRAIDLRIPGFHRFIVSGATPFRREQCRELYVNASSLIRAHAPDLAREFGQRGWRLPTKIDRVYDSKWAQKELGWRPKYSFDSVLKMLDTGNPEVLPVMDDR